MFNKFRRYFAYILLVLVPLQSLAASNMLICSNASPNKMQSSMHSMHCHEPINTGTSGYHDNHLKHSFSGKCQSGCTTLCANFAGVAELPHPIVDIAPLNSSTKLGFSLPAYLSANLANLQRPPIYLS